MLRKGAIVVSYPKEDHFLSPWCLGKKRNGRNHPAVNLKDVNNNIAYQHTKQKLLFPLNKMLLPYFVIYYSMESRKNLRFWWKGLLYNFYCLFRDIFSSFGLYKVIKSLSLSSLSLLRKLNVRMITYLKDAITSSLEDLLMGRDSLIIILQHLSFLINIKTSCLQPTSTLNFSGY